MRNVDAAAAPRLTSASAADPNLTTISPVNKPHPREDVIISGSSRSLYAWRPVPDGAHPILTASPLCSARAGIQSLLER